MSKLLRYETPCKTAGCGGTIKSTYSESGYRYSRCTGTCGYTYNNAYTQGYQAEEDARVRAEAKRINRETVL